MPKQQLPSNDSEMDYVLQHSEEKSIWVCLYRSLNMLRVQNFLMILMVGECAIIVAMLVLKAENPPCDVVLRRVVTNGSIECVVDVKAGDAIHALWIALMSITGVFVVEMVFLLCILRCKFWTNPFYISDLIIAVTCISIQSAAGDKYTSANVCGLFLFARRWR